MLGARYMIFQKKIKKIKEWLESQYVKSASQDEELIKLLDSHGL
jgi:hypothetical protein